MGHYNYVHQGCCSECLVADVQHDNGLLSEVKCESDETYTVTTWMGLTVFKGPRNCANESAAKELVDEDGAYVF